MKELRPGGHKRRSSGVVTRRTVEPYDHRGKRIVVALEPGDVIAFRFERERKWFRAPLARVCRHVIMWNVDAERSKKKQQE